MQATTLSFNNIHTYGELFTNLLKARYESFSLGKPAETPGTEGMEFDQYDTPDSRWVAIHDAGHVLGGFRLTPTTAECGMYSYMIKDAQAGLSEAIPDDLLYVEAPCAPHIFEFSRFFITDGLPSHTRKTVQSRLLYALLETRQTLGVEIVLGLGSVSLGRWMKRSGLEIDPLGPIIEIDGKEHQSYIVNLPEVAL
ncbi:N-acyl-L-homoserine lactone synthetase [Amylibacter sp. SFDW26]|uniref:acyl-homoserine-lactone synthase n=1 Tax=Amylibacter sp. SFDW26 TaxID=2652722 RepID=UPI0012625E49|nr:acyl-homoserine-lactone synthase [Amylibacter sp. SFDW26]KAB7613280.1 N-acyl-L-homoserine lactone synthetase [Amylibacter sp. SFDW26]